VKEKAKRIALVAVPTLLAVVLALEVLSREDAESQLAGYLLSNAAEQDLVILVSSDFGKLARLEGLRVLYADQVYWNDVMGYDRAWIVGPPWLEVPMIGEVSVEEVGSYLVHRIDMGEVYAEERGYNLLRRLGSASVHRLEDVIKPCPMRTGQFACEGDPWMSVSIQRVQMGGAPFECIYAHPKDGSQLVIVFPATPGGQSLSLEGGIDDDGVYYPQGAEVLVRAELAGQEVGRTSFTNTPGIQKRTIDFAKPVDGPVPLVIKITSANQDTRHFCFTGWLQAGSPDAAR
jgi:hypothetical protein